MLCMFSSAAITAINITYRTNGLLSWERARGRERECVREGIKNTDAGMIACQDKWHQSISVELHIHTGSDSSHAYTGWGGKKDDSWSALVMFALQVSKHNTGLFKTAHFPPSLSVDFDMSMAAMTRVKWKVVYTLMKNLGDRGSVFFFGNFNLWTYLNDSDRCGFL